MDHKQASDAVSSDAVTPEEGKAIPAYVPDWLRELLEHHQELFDLTTAIRHYQRPNRASRAGHGQIWRALPEPRKLSLCYKDNEWPGIVTLRRDERGDERFKWEPTPKPEHSGPQAGKLLPNHKADGRILPELDLRVGLILTPGDDASTAPDAPRRGIFIKGSGTKPRNTHRRGELFLDYRQLPRHLRNNYHDGVYMVQAAWGIDLELRRVLLKFFAHANMCPPTRGHNPPESAIHAAERLLGELIGVRSTSPGDWRSWWDPRPDPPERGEVVLVTYNPTLPPIPSLVVSPDALNRRSNVAVVLQFVEYGENHDPDAKPFIPIGDCGAVAGLDGRWSVTPIEVRGIFDRETYVQPLKPTRVRLDRVSPTVFEYVEWWLRKYYAKTP